MPSPSRTPPVLAVTRKESPVDRNQTKPAFNSIASASAAVRRGSLGMNFDRGGQNLLAQCGRALFISQGLQKELNCLADIDKVSPRRSCLEIGTPSVLGTTRSNRAGPVRLR